MQINITLELSKQELDLIQHALFLTCMQLYDIQDKSKESDDIEEFDKMANFYEKLTGNDCKRMIANANIMREIDNE